MSTTALQYVLKESKSKNKASTSQNKRKFNTEKKKKVN